jgi:hypothetical protein
LFSEAVIIHPPTNGIKKHTKSSTERITFAKHIVGCVQKCTHAFIFPLTFTTNTLFTRRVYRSSRNVTPTSHHHTHTHILTVIMGCWERKKIHEWCNANSNYAGINNADKCEWKFQAAKNFPFVIKNILKIPK